MPFSEAPKVLNRPQGGKTLVTPTRTGEARPRYTSESLFGKSPTLVIEHEGAVYQLRITGQNKLILTK